MPGLYCLAHVVGWEPYNLHDQAHVPWVGSVLYRSCTIITAGQDLDDLDHDLSDVWNISVRNARRLG